MRQEGTHPGQESPLGVLPADQGLEGLHLAVRPDERLIPGPELLGAERRADGDLEVELGRAGLRLGTGDGDAVATAALGDVHGEIGVAQQTPARRGVRGVTRSRHHRHADAHTDDDRVGADGERPAQRGHDGLGHLDRLLGARAVQHDDELVTAEPGDHVAGGLVGEGPDAGRDLGEHGVTDVMTAGVVDHLEPVEIAEEDGDR